MILKYASWMEACGVNVERDSAGVPLHKLEIDPCFALDANELAEKLGAGFVFDADLLLTEDKC
jgi:hypothetical protein